MEKRKRNKSLLKNISKSQIAKWKRIALRKKAKKILVFYNFIMENYYACFLLPGQEEGEIIKKTIGRDEINDIFAGSICIRPKLEKILRGFKKRKRKICKKLKKTK